MASACTLPVTSVNPLAWSATALHAAPIPTAVGAPVPASAPMFASNQRSTAAENSVRLKCSVKACPVAGMTTSVTLPVPV